MNPKTVKNGLNRFSLFSIHIPEGGKCTYIDPGPSKSKQVIGTCCGGQCMVDVTECRDYCGDGYCSQWEEMRGSCPDDCVEGVQPTVSR